MRIFLKAKDNEGEKKYIDLSFWSIVKANLLSNLVIAAIIYGGGFFLGLILMRIFQ